MANPYVSGPVQIYLRTNHTITGSGYGAGLTSLLTYPANGGEMSYLGTCQEAPQIQISPHYKNLISDLNGGEVPFDFAFAGEDARILMLLTEWNEYVYYQLSAIPIPSGTRGAYTAASIGSLMLHDMRAASVWFYFPYGTAKFAQGAAGGFYSPGGYRFVACVPTGQDLTIGTRAGKRLVSLQALPVYNPANGEFTLYDHTMTYIPTIPPVNTTGSLS